MEEKNKGQWHLEKSISIGHILTTVIIAGSVFTWAMKMNSRVTVLETHSAYSKATDERMDMERARNLAEVKAILIRIEDKLDQKADK